jgi:hypothetical protein
MEERRAFSDQHKGKKHGTSEQNKGSKAVEKQPFCGLFVLGMEWPSWGNEQLCHNAHKQLF